MSSQICLPKNYLVIIITIFMSLTIWYIQNQQSNYNNNFINKLTKQILELKNNNQPIQQPTQQQQPSIEQRPTPSQQQPFIEQSQQQLSIEQRPTPSQQQPFIEQQHPTPSQQQPYIEQPQQQRFIEQQHPTPSQQQPYVEQSHPTPSQQQPYVEQSHPTPLQQLPSQLINVSEINVDDIERKLYLNQRDANVLYNEFAPPERRVADIQYPYRYVKNQLNIPTRGYPDNYQLMGILLRDNTETSYNLFGRQKFPGSNQYDYYVQGKMGYNDVKIPINSIGDREIEDGITIKIPGTDYKKGNFKVKLYNLDAPRYIPFI
jgi:hypothetical protein